MTEIVLDASAILAMLLAEPGADKVADAIQGASISAVNFSEVGAKAVDHGADIDLAFSKLREMPLRVVPFDRDQAETASRLRQATRSLGLSLGDRACLALAQCLGARVLTADKAWVSLDLGIEIVLIRQ